MAVTRDSGFPVSARDTTANATDFAGIPTFTTPGTNRFAVAMFILNGGTTNAIDTCTSGNLTWTRAIGAVDSTNNWRVEIWYAWAASVVTNEQIDITYLASRSYNRQSVVIWSFDGADSSSAGNTASDVDGDANDPDISITATGAGSYLVGGVPYRSAGGDITVDGNTTSEYDAGGGGGFGFNERAGSRTSSGAGALTIGYQGGETFLWLTMAAFEVKQAAGGGGDAVPVAWRQYRGRRVS